MSSGEPPQVAILDAARFRFAFFDELVIAPRLDGRIPWRPGLSNLWNEFSNLEIREVASVAAIAASSGLMPSDGVLQLLADLEPQVPEQPLDVVESPNTRFLLDLESARLAASGSTLTEQQPVISQAIDQYLLFAQRIDRIPAVRWVMANALFVDDDRWARLVSELRSELSATINAPAVDPLSIADPYLAVGVEGLDSIVRELGWEPPRLQLWWRASVYDAQDLISRLSARPYGVGALLVFLIGWRFGLTSEDAAARFRERLHLARSVLEEGVRAATSMAMNREQGVGRRASATPTDPSTGRDPRL